MQNLTEFLSDEQRATIDRLEDVDINFQIDRPNTPPDAHPHDCAVLRGFSEYRGPGQEEINALSLHTLLGWRYLHTNQDAPYFGILYDIPTLQILSYVESDVFLTCAPGYAQFVGVLRSHAQYHNTNCPVPLPTPSPTHALSIWHEVHEKDLTVGHHEKGAESVNDFETLGALVIPADDPGDVAIYHKHDAYILAAETRKLAYCSQTAPPYSLASVDLDELTDEHPRPTTYDPETATLPAVLASIGWTWNGRTAPNRPARDPAGHYVGTFTPAELWLHLEKYGFARPLVI